MSPLTLSEDLGPSKFLSVISCLTDRTTPRTLPAMAFFIPQAAFYYMAAASVASALLAVTRKNPVHSMLWVLALFLHVAGIFLLLGAEFLAAVQVIVYAGAILVFYIFVLMLLDLPGEEARPRFAAHWPFAVAGGLSFAALVWLSGSVGPSVRGSVGQSGDRPTTAVLQTDRPTDPQTHTAGTPTHAPTATEDPPPGSLSAVGHELFGPFALPFEIASLVLLAAIVGGVVLAKRRTAE